MGAGGQRIGNVRTWHAGSVSDEIPVGSPPAPPGRHAAPGGWYADPANDGQERYWDGWQWTRNVRPRAGAKPQATPPTEQHAQPGVPPMNQLPPQSGYAPPPGHGAPMYKLVPATADGVPLAGWWWRVLAYVIDFFLITAVAEIISRTLGWSAAISKAQNEYMAYVNEALTTGGNIDFFRALEIANVPEQSYLTYTTMALFVIYSGLMLRARGATLGKMLCRLRVVPIDQGRSTPGLPTAAAWLRPLATKMMELLFFLQIIDFLFPLWDRRKQTIHDKIVRTQVIREERRQR